MRKVRILGSGVSAWACAATLAGHGWAVTIHGKTPKMPQRLVVSSETLEELSSIPRQAVIRRFSGHRLDELEFYWGNEHFHLREQGWAVDGETFMNELRTFMRTAPGDAIEWIPRIEKETSPEDVWCVDTLRSAQYQQDPENFFFGQRSSLLTVVELAAGFNQRACIMEATAEGWMYLAPIGDQRALFQAIIPSDRICPQEHVKSLLARAKRIAAAIGPTTGEFQFSPAAPFLTGPLIENRRVCIGRAALGVDPISGDGVGCAVSSAILAAAVMEAMEKGEDSPACCSFYKRSLRNTMHEHLRACAQLYDLGIFSDSWGTEIRQNLDAAEWLGHLLHREDPPKYWLNGYDLERIPETA